MADKQITSSLTIQSEDCPNDIKGGSSGGGALIDSPPTDQLNHGMMYINSHYHTTPSMLIHSNKPSDNLEPSFEYNTTQTTSNFNNRDHEMLTSPSTNYETNTINSFIIPNLGMQWNLFGGEFN